MQAVKLNDFVPKCFVCSSLENAQSLFSFTSENIKTHYIVLFLTNLFIIKCLLLSTSRNDTKYT